MTNLLRARIAICLFLALIFSGCTPKIRKLEIVRIGNLRLDSVTKEILTLRAELAIKNPYSSSARLNNISFDVALTDHFIAYGKRTDSMELKPGSIAVFDVPLALRVREVTEKDLAALLSQNIPYRIQGTAVLERPFGPRTLPIDIRNEIEGPDHLQVFLQHQTASSILSLNAFQTKEFLSLIRRRKLSVLFNNPFSFPLTIRDFHYDVRLAKHVIAEGESQNHFQLLPGENRMELGIHPKPLGAVETMLQGLLDKELPRLSLFSEFKIVRQNRDLAVRLIYIPE